EVQPQLVLLQKTLLNVEGLGRQLDPSLDLWKTAKPYLENWMRERVGTRAIWLNLQRESEQWARILPALPRLIHQRLEQPSPVLAVQQELHRLRKSQERSARQINLLLALLVAAVIVL